MPRGRTTQAVMGGLVMLVFTTQHLAAQTPYEPYEAAPPRGVSEGEAVEDYSHAVPGYGREAYPDVMPGHAGGWGAEPPPTGMDQIRQYPHPGPEWAATHGYPNYDYPDRLFGVWFRAKAWGLTHRERCGIPDPWRPRGFGNLFARPSTPHRMDYNRRVLIDPHTGYGPSYYVRQPDPRCCARTCDGHDLWVQTRYREAVLKERLDEGTQVRIR